MNEVLIYGPIYSENTREFFESFSEIEGDAVTLRINTGGGSVEDGWAMIGKFNEFQGTKVAKVDGKAYSMGAFICLYADAVECFDVSQFMFHRASYGVYYEKEWMSDAEKTNLANVNKKLREAFEAKIDVAKFEALKVCKDNGITVNRLFSMDERIDVYLTADEAKKIGLVKTVNKLTPQKAASINSMVSDVYKKAASSNEVENLFVAAIVAENPVNAGTENVNLIVMNRSELQAKHPELFAEIIGLGVAQERDRVGAWTAFIDVDAKAVKDGIAGGESLTQTAMAEFSLKMFSNQRNAGLEAESKETPGANAGAQTPPNADGEQSEAQKLEASIKTQLGIKS